MNSIILLANTQTCFVIIQINDVGFSAYRWERNKEIVLSETYLMAKM